MDKKRQQKMKANRFEQVIKMFMIIILVLFVCQCFYFVINYQKISDAAHQIYIGEKSLEDYQEEYYSVILEGKDTSVTLGKFLNKRYGALEVTFYLDYSFSLTTNIKEKIRRVGIEDMLLVCILEISCYAILSKRKKRKP